MVQWDTAFPLPSKDMLQFAMSQTEMVILVDLIMTLCFLRKTTNLAKCCMASWVGKYWAPRQILPVNGRDSAGKSNDEQ